MKPPFPAVSGLYACPTVVNNVETLTAVPDIIKMGGEAYQKLGTEKSGGTKLWSVSVTSTAWRLRTADGLRRHGKVHHGRLRRDPRRQAAQSRDSGGSSVYIMRADQIIGKDVRWITKDLWPRVRVLARVVSS